MFADEIWEIVNAWETFAKLTVGKQLVRSADSIGANIAEGTGGGTAKDNQHQTPLYRRTSVKLKIVLEASEEGGYTVYVPSLPGCISEGDTKEDALANIREAIELYLEPVEDDNTILPGSEIEEIAI